MKLSGLVLLAASMTDAAPAAEAAAPAAAPAEAPVEAAAPTKADAWMRIARALFTESEMNELASAFEDNADLEDDAEDDTEESLEDDNDFSLEDLMEMASMFEDNSEDHESDPSADFEP